LEQMDSERKAVVFYDFTHSGRKIVERAKAFQPIWLWSGTQNYRADLDRFTRNSKCRVAVVNNRVGAYALDGLQAANYLFFYETPVGVIDREQAEKRVRRPGQQHFVYQYDLVVRGSADARILEYHGEGRELYKELTAAPEKFFSGA